MKASGKAVELANQIRPALGISEPYAAFVQSGKRIPHPRHWQALTQLVGVSANAYRRPAQAAAVYYGGLVVYEAARQRS